MLIQHIVFHVEFIRANLLREAEDFNAKKLTLYQESKNGKLTLPLKTTLTRKTTIQLQTTLK